MGREEDDVRDREGACLRRVGLQDVNDLHRREHRERLMRNPSREQHADRDTR
jgi:hypothetical protein